MNRWIVVFFAPFLFAQAEKAKLHVGLILPLTGDLENFGKDLRAGARIALEEFATLEPELAAKVVIEEKDYGADPKKVADLTKELIAARRADVLIGPLTGSTTIGLYRSLDDAQRPFISATSGTAQITRLGENVFRTCLADHMQGRMMASFAAQDLKKTKAAILVEEGSEYGNSIANAFEQDFKNLGGTIVSRVSFAPGTTDFQKYLITLKKKSPQVILLPSHYQDAAKVLDQAKAEGLKASFLGTDGWDSPKLYKLASKENLKGHYYFSHFSSNDSDPLVRQFIKRFSEMEKREPSFYAAMGYDAFNLVIDAYKRAHTNLGSSLVKALATAKDVRSLTGAMSINSQRDAVKGAAILATSVDGPQFKARFGMQIKVATP